MTLVFQIVPNRASYRANWAKGAIREIVRSISCVFSVRFYFASPATPFLPCAITINPAKGFPVSRSSTCPEIRAEGINSKLRSSEAPGLKFKGIRSGANAGLGVSTVTVPGEPSGLASSDQAPFSSAVITARGQQ